MPWPRKGKSQNNKHLKWAILPARVQKPSLTLFLFLWGQDAETEQCFPHFHKLQQTAFPESQYVFVLMLSSHRYWTQSISPVLQSFTARLQVSPSRQKVKSSFLHQRNSLMQGHCSRGQQLWPLASPPGDTRETSILYPLWGKWTKKNDHLNANRTSLFLLLPNLLIMQNYYDEMSIMSNYLWIEIMICDALRRKSITVLCEYQQGCSEGEKMSNDLPLSDQLGAN